MQSFFALHENAKTTLAIAKLFALNTNAVRQELTVWHLIKYFWGISEWALYHQNIWNKVEFQLCEKLTTEHVKGEGRYIHGKPKMWKEQVEKNPHG